jgi:50S ribosomal protein L16 3-hydroxylase
MIASWLQPMTMAEFQREHFQRAPLARPSSARGAVDRLTWGTLESLLEAEPELLVVKNGKVLEERPRSTEEAIALFRGGTSLVLRHCEHNDEGLHRLAAAVGAELEGDVTIHVFVTPTGFHSFGWHYDCEDVFIVQTYGSKEYFLRRNTVNPYPTIDAMPRDMQYERETSPATATTLLPGDWLYIPRGWWHVARCIESSLSISIGVLAPNARRQ